MTPQSLNNDKTIPPFIKPGERIVLYDGVCRLCNAWVQFIVKYDKRFSLKLCAVQSPQGQALLKYFSYPTETFNTMLVIENGAVYEKSQAFFKAIYQFGFPWNLVKFFKIIPKPAADWLYDRIARNRYRIFGKSKVCLLTIPNQEQRLIDGKA